LEMEPCNPKLHGRADKKARVFGHLNATISINLLDALRRKERVRAVESA